jgi:hypothetical protein
LQVKGGAFLEPSADPHLLSRDYSRSSKVRELERAWTSYARVSALEIDGKKHLGVLGNGEGHAPFPAFSGWADAGARVRNSSSLVALSLGAPKDFLVLFAGAGTELVDLKAHSPAGASVDGVEINGRLTELARRLPLRFEELLATPGVRLLESDARAFLESSQKLYDVILYSWPGATEGQQLGGTGHTASYSYTAEGLRAALARLKPSGMLVLLGAPKERLLSSLRKLAAPAKPFSEQIVVLHGGGRETSPSLEGARLLVRPSGFSAAEVREIEAKLSAAGFEIGLAPGIAALDELKALVPLVSGGGSKELSYDDDNPFVLAPRRLSPLPLLLVSVCAALFIAVGLRGLGSVDGPVRVAPFFLLVGAAYVLVQSVLLNKLVLFFGSPTRALAFGMPLYLSGVALGLWRRPKAAASALPNALIGSALGLAFFLGGEALLKESLLALPTSAKAGLLFVLLLPTGYFGGRLYPYGLAAVSAAGRRVTLLAVALDTAAGSWALAAAPWLVHRAGFRACLLATALAYFIGRWAMLRAEKSRVDDAGRSIKIKHLSPC